MGFYLGVNMYTNSSCTLYLKSNNYVPIVILHAFFTQRKNVVMTKKGISYDENVFVMFNPIENEFNDGSDYIVEGVCNFTFQDPTNQAKMSADLKAFNEQYEVYTIMAAHRKNYGHKNMRHIELSCK